MSSQNALLETTISMYHNRTVKVVPGANEIEAIDYCQYVRDVKAGVKLETPKHMRLCGYCIIEAMVFIAREENWSPLGKNEADLFFASMIITIFKPREKPHPKTKGFFAYLARNNESRRRFAAALYTIPILQQKFLLLTPPKWE